MDFTQPQNLNGAELLQELQSAGISVATAPTIDGQGKMWLDIDTKDKTKAEFVVANHNGTIIAPEPTIADKLASVGLTVNDLKAALGL